MRRSTARGLGLVVALGLASPPAVHAEETRTRDPARVARLELDSAIGLYFTSGLLMTGGGIGLLTGVIALLDSDDGGSRDVALAAVVGSGVAAPLSLLVLAVAIGLDVDAFFRRRSAREAPTVEPGPGDVGLSLGWRWDG